MCGRPRQEHLGFHDPGPLAREVHGHAVRRSFDARDLGSAPEVEPFRATVGEASCDVVVEDREQHRFLLDDRDVRAERGEHMAELGRAGAAADDHHRRGARVDPHDRVGRVERNVVEAGDLRDDGAGAGREDHVFAPELFPADFEHPRRDEPRLAEVHVDTAAPAVHEPVGGVPVEAREHAVADRGPVRAEELGVDPVPAGGAHRLRDVGRVRQHLRRDTTAIQARAAEAVALDDRDPQTVDLRHREHVARPRADDHQVVVDHRRRIRQPGSGVAKRDNGWWRCRALRGNPENSRWRNQRMAAITRQQLVEKSPHGADNSDNSWCGRSDPAGRSQSGSNRTGAPNAARRAARRSAASTGVPAMRMSSALPAARGMSKPSALAR